VDVRVIVATNRNLKEAVEQGSFREDLYYRLNVFPLRVPPLRERSEDILTLARAFIEEFNSAMGKRIDTISISDISALEKYTWPGNVRELRNIIERAMIISGGTRLQLELPETTAVGTVSDLTLEALERGHIKKILDATYWRIRGPHGAANILGIHPTTLYFRMKKWVSASRHCETK
jgi:formate hydrogenlyase transcriptional activator